MIDGLLDFRDLISVNHSLIQCRHKNKCKRNDCNHNSIDYLLKNINSSLENQLNCGYHSLKFISKDELLKHENNLCEFIRGIAHQETSIRKVCESLHELSRFSVSQESQIENLLKYLVNICVQSSCPKLQEVGKVAQKIKVL